MNLFTIKNDLDYLYECLMAAEAAGDKEAAQDILVTIGDVEHDMKKKIENTIKFIKNNEADAAACMKQAEEFEDRATVAKNKARRAKEYIMSVMDAEGLKKIDAGLFKASVVNNGGSAPIIYDVPMEEIPGEYITEEVVRKLNTQKIREDLGAGEVLPWFHMGDRGRHISIR